MLSTEFLFSSTNIRIPLLYPSSLGAMLDDQWSTFEVNNFAFNSNLLLSVKLLSRANSPFLLGGIQYSLNSYSEDQGTLNSDVSTSLSIFISDNELYGTLYNDNTRYFNLILGFGIQKENNSYSFRYIHRLSKEEYLPSARFTRVEVVYSFNLVFQKLRKGPKIYID